jgi:hypothetical protein
MNNFHYKIHHNQNNNIQCGGTKYGCCANNCDRNGNEFILLNADTPIHPITICCKLCITGKHTYECDQKQKKNKLCNNGCKRFVKCGIDIKIGQKFSHCCNECENSNGKLHSEECEYKHNKISFELINPSQQTSLLQIYPISNQGKSLDKEIMKQFNETFKPENNNMIRAIEIIRPFCITPNIKIKDNIMRILSKCSEFEQTIENNNAGLNFFIELFLNESRIFEIDEAISTIGLKLMMNANINFISILQFIEKIFAKIEITRRVLSAIFMICAKYKCVILAFEFLKFGIIHDILFTNQDYEYILDSFDLKYTISKDTILEIMFYMEAQDYFSKDDNKITQKTANLLNFIFTNSSNIVKIAEINCFCNKCNTQLKPFILDLKEKLAILNFIENEIEYSTHTDFKKTISFIKQNKASYIIDGANVGYNTNEKLHKQFGMIDYYKLDQTLIQLPLDASTIIFLHARHQKYINKDLIIQWKQRNINVHWTPYDMYDDLFWIYAILYHDAYFISNDNMKDHVVEMFSKISPINFYLWKKIRQITHEFNIRTKTMHLTFPPKCIKKIQHNENIWHFPIGDDLWLCLHTNI